MKFENGIHISSPFSLSAKSPLDTRLIVNNTTELLALPNIQKYEGMHVYVLDQKMWYGLNGSGNWEIKNITFINGTGAPTATTGEGGDIYLDKSNGDIYHKQISNQSTLVYSWVYVANLTGTQGIQGPKGSTGTRGSLWYYGDKITGVYDGDDGAIITGSDVEYALVGDLYYNSTLYNIYTCVAEGADGTAAWKYLCNIKGIKGDTGPTGATGATGPQGVRGIESASQTIELKPSDWTKDPDSAYYIATVTIDGIDLTDNTDIYVTPTGNIASMENIISHYIMPYEENIEDNTLTFCAIILPTDITVNFDIRIVNYAS